ncbi:hypothetical protein C8F01DRAFT_1235494 [Mycena amicta]|nr:hypothetical protein C8F01DRAFT_1235494 [Mycena amicta]
MRERRWRTRRGREIRSSATDKTSFGATWTLGEKNPFDVTRSQVATVFEEKTIAPMPRFSFNSSFNIVFSQETLACSNVAPTTLNTTHTPSCMSRLRRSTSAARPLGFVVNNTLRLRHPHLRASKANPGTICSATRRLSRLNVQVLLNVPVWLELSEVNARSLRERLKSKSRVGCVAQKWCRMPRRGPRGFQRGRGLCSNKTIVRNVAAYGVPLQASNASSTKAPSTKAPPNVCASGSPSSSSLRESPKKAPIRMLRTLFSCQWNETLKLPPTSFRRTR